VPAGFQLYGGPEAVNVARIAGGPSGWLVVGNRLSGATVWVSPDSTEFDIVDRAPGLASDEQGRTMAFDAVAVVRGWLVAGSIRRVGRTAPEPVVWSSADGRTWQRALVPVTDGSAELHRVVLVGTTPVAVGVRDGAFGAWVDGGRGWTEGGRFGRGIRPGVPSVRGVSVHDGRLLVAASNGTAYELWASVDQGRSWRQVVGLPAATSATGDSAIAVAVGAGRLLVAVDDGGDGRVWSSRVDW